MLKRVTKQKVGLLFALIACVVFWLPLYTTRQYFLFIPLQEKTLNLLPTLASGVFALLIIFLIYVRKIIVFKSKRLHFISFLINWVLFATFVEILIFPYAGDGYTVFTDNAFSLVMAGAFVAVILFGLKEIAKIALLIFIAGSFFSNFMTVSQAMGIFGFIALMCIIISFYLQGNIELHTLKDEARYLIS